jgi:hypothetical protein
LQPTPGKVISTILRHDAKVTSYKIALLRAINDVVLSYPDLGKYDSDIAVPLRHLAEFWLAYYWPFVSATAPIMQGPRSQRGSTLSNDMAFRPTLQAFRSFWEQFNGAASRPSDGFFVINELRLPRKRAVYPEHLLASYDRTLNDIARTIEMPIRYAGPAGAQWSVFPQPDRLANLSTATAVPGAWLTDICLQIPSTLWNTFRELSLWIEALCIHEWCLFTENVQQPPTTNADRGHVYTLLTDRPDNRRLLTWERNNIDILLMEGSTFVCPWTERRITGSTGYDLDHIVPIALYPINELWNLVPSDPNFNSHTKRDRLPSPQSLQRSFPHLIRAYENYESHEALSKAIHEDAQLRFYSLRAITQPFASTLARSVSDFVTQLAQARNIALF